MKCYLIVTDCMKKTIFINEMKNSKESILIKTEKNS